MLRNSSKRKKPLNLRAKSFPTRKQKRASNLLTGDKSPRANNTRPGSSKLLSKPRVKSLRPGNDRRLRANDLDLICSVGDRAAGKKTENICRTGSSNISYSDG